MTADDPDDLIPWHGWPGDTLPAAIPHGLPCPAHRAPIHEPEPGLSDTEEILPLLKAWDAGPISNRGDKT